MKYKGFDYELKENDGKWTFVLTHTKYSEDADTKEDAIRKVQDYIDNNLVSNMEKFKEKVLAYKNKFKKESYKEEFKVGDRIKSGSQGKDKGKIIQMYNDGSLMVRWDSGDETRVNSNYIKKESFKEEITIDLSKRSIADIKNILKMLDDESVWYSVFGHKLTVDEDEIRGNFDLAQQKFIYKESMNYQKGMRVRTDEGAGETPQDEIDKIIMDVPLLTRVLEYFNENSMDDVKLHKILENLIRESKKGMLGISDYENIIKIDDEEEPIKAEEERYDNISQDKLNEIIKYIEENKNRSNLILKAAIKHYFNEEIDEADILKYKKGIESKTESEKSDVIEVDGQKINVVISGSGNKASSMDDERHFVKVDGKWVIDFTESGDAEEFKEGVNKFDELFDKYVPSEGKADSVLGEMLRAIGRLEYRMYNDGDMFFTGYGVETCGASATYLKRATPLSSQFKPYLISMEKSTKTSDAEYKKGIENLKKIILNLSEKEIKKYSEILNYVDSREFANDYKSRRYEDEEDEEKLKESTQSKTSNKKLQKKKESVIVIFNRSVDKDKVRDFKRDADKALGYNFIENDNEPYLFTFNDMDENIVKGLLKRNNLQRGDFQIKTKVNTYEKLKQLKEKLKK